MDSNSPKSTKDLLKTFKKTYGEQIGGLGARPGDVKRMPTGVFAFDLASGGGFPERRLSILYGPESSGKTILLQKAIAWQQKYHPERVNAFFDIENTFDPKWAEKLGVNIDKLMIFRPDYAEQAVDMIEALLKADDCGIVGLDSAAALIGMRELNQSAEKDPVGGASLIVSKLVKRSIWAMAEAEKQGSFGTLVLINQTRTKIGVMYGDPETYPGGQAQRSGAALICRMYGKNIIDNAHSKTMPCRKSHSVVIKKWKMPILATHVEWETVTIPHDGNMVGYTGGWNDAEKVLRAANKLVKVKDGWKLGTETLPTLTEWKNRFDTDMAFKALIVERIVSSETGLSSEGEVEEDEDNDHAA